MGSERYFEEVAEKWDRMREGFFSSRVREVAMETAGVMPGKLAADIGAGTGFVTEGLIDRGLDVIAVDQSDAMLNIMKKKFARFDNITYRVGESHSLPVQDASIDYVFSNMYLHHTESPHQAIQEMARILKSGGKLVVTDMDEHEYAFLKKEQHDIWLGFKREDVKSWFLEAGLKEFRIDCAGENCTSSSVECEDRADINIFVAVGTKK